jgi:predicted NBD/HSP70 family sugar kinase
MGVPAGDRSIDLVRAATSAAGPVTGGSVADDTRAHVFATILTAGPVSRTELARRTGLSQSTVTKAVNPLLDAGYLVEAGESSSGMGRPQRLLRVATDRHMVVGVKLAPAHVTAVLTDLEAGVLARSRRTLDGDHRPGPTLAAATAVAGDLLTGHPHARDRLIGVGVGVGGHIDSKSGRCVHSGVLGWHDVDIARPLSAATGPPTVVNNDVNTLVIAEQWFGAGQGVRSFAVVTVGAGVGGGLLIGGDLHVGASGLAGEIGHIPLQPDGPDCSCGSRGCLETVASCSAVLADIEARGGPRCASFEEAARLARTGETAATAAFAAMGEALGRGLATLCNLLNLEKIILSGEGVQAYDLFGPACEESRRMHGFSTAVTDCALVVDAVDDDLWARGAACLVIREAVGASLSYS